MIKKNIFIVLILILIVAACLRIYNIGINPPSLTWDEVAWGYNAYSLGLDGRDEFGRFLPHDYLESFGDFKPPVYAYLDVIPIKIFGLNEFATRLPSAIFGVLTVLMTYFLTKRIFKKSDSAEPIALIAAGLLAISPWHILLSRAAFEANVSSFFIVVGVWGFLAGVQDRKWYLTISAVSFVLSMYTFNTSRVVVPIIVLVLAAFFWRKLFAIKKQVIIAGAIGLLLLLPVVGFLLSPQAGLRFKEVNIFSDPQVVKTANQQIQNDGGAWWSKILHNRRVLYAREYVIHYFDNLNPLFLFTRGDGNPKFSLQTVGQLYSWEAIFFVAGALFLFRKREGNWWLLPVWLLVGIIPAATARETPHALRIETTLPTFQIIIAYGIFNLFALLKHKIKGVPIKKLAIAALVLVAVFNLVFFVHEYSVHYPHKWSSEWQYGYKESIRYVQSVEKDFDYIQVSSGLGRPYMYYLFYTKTEPSEFRRTARVKRDAFGFVKVEGFGKYLFPEDFRLVEDKSKKVLYISTPYGIPEGVKILKTFKSLDGQSVLVAYTI